MTNTTWHVVLVLRYLYQYKKAKKNLIGINIKEQWIVIASKAKLSPTNSFYFLQIDCFIPKTFGIRNDSNKDFLEQNINYLTYII